LSKEEIQMDKKHMEKCSSSLAIKEMQIKTKLRFHLTPEHHQQQMLVRMREKETLIHCWRECKLVQPLWKTIWRLLKNLNIDLPYDPAIPLLGIYTQRNVTQVTPEAPAHPCLLQHYLQ
jgi:hypothetical protein